MSKDFDTGRIAGLENAYLICTGQARDRREEAASALFSDVCMALRMEELSALSCAAKIMAILTPLRAAPEKEQAA